MKTHNGMRPQDIAVLLKIVAKHKQPWLMKDLSKELMISASEVSESINRSVISGLLASDKTRLMKSSLLDFLEYGLKYVFPQKPGFIVRGIATAHSAAPLNNEIDSRENFVWPYPEGNMRGQGIEPLYKNMPEACLKDPDFYELAALCDAIRVGKVRERNMAVEALKKRIC